jgi:hypothetical protein
MEPVAKKPKTSSPLPGLVCIKNLASSGRDDVLLLDSPNEREMQVLGALQNMGDEEYMPFAINELSEELVEDDYSKDVRGEDLFYFLWDVAEYDNEEKLFELCSAHPTTRSERRDFNKKLKIISLLGGIAALKNLMKRLCYDCNDSLPTEFVPTVFVYMD